jgi:hypothetical protein
LALAGLDAIWLLLALAGKYRVFLVASREQARRLEVRGHRLEARDVHAARRAIPQVVQIAADLALVQVQ